VLPKHDLVVSNVRCALFDSGPRDATEAVVFVHGNPGPLDDWEFAIPDVARAARVVALDLPAFGDAERPRTFDFSVTGYATYLAGVLEQLGISRAHLVLHDFGGAWGLAWARAHPQAVLSITLINAVPLSVFRWHFFARLWQVPLLGSLFQRTTNATAIRFVMNRDNPRPFPEAFTKRVTAYADVEQKLAVVKIYRAARDTQATFASMAPDLSALRVPVCVIWGEGDIYLRPEHAESFQRVFADCELHRLPGLGHWPFIDDPDAVREPLLSFLKRHGALKSARAT
jgi:pimeloyl-ACP methyl ester carboxylesterase